MRWENGHVSMTSLSLCTIKLNESESDRESANVHVSLFS